VSPFVYPRGLTDEQKAERRRLAEQARRIAAVKAFLLGAGVLVGIVAAGAGLLYLAVLVVRRAWGGS
jgi:Mg2+/citrate symporter